MSDIVERLRQGVDPDDIPETERAMDAGAAEIERLRAALEPFARNVDAVSLSEALGHIEREHLHNARRALEQKP